MAPAAVRPARRDTTLFLLTLTLLASFTDRNLLASVHTHTEPQPQLDFPGSMSEAQDACAVVVIQASMFEPLRLELQLTDSQLGFLSGMAFSVCGAVFGLTMGFLTDRFNRKWLLVRFPRFFLHSPVIYPPPPFSSPSCWLIFAQKRQVVSIAVWSAATVGQGLTVGYVQLVVMRVLVGVGEAAGGPVAHSMICDLFVPERRGFALSVWNMGIPAGTLLGLLLGGELTASMGWRNAFIVVGSPGLLLALMFALCAKEPTRGGLEPTRRQVAAAKLAAGAI